MMADIRWETEPVSQLSADTEKPVVFFKCENVHPSSNRILFYLSIIIIHNNTKLI